MGSGSPGSLLVGPTRPPVPLVVGKSKATSGAVLSSVNLSFDATRKTFRVVPIVLQKS